MAILFPLMRTNFASRNSGIGPVKPSMALLPVRWLMSGTTKNSEGTAIGSCVVDLFRTTNDVNVDATISDTTIVGAFSFSVGLSQAYYAVAYLAGSPDIAGTTVNTLIGVEG